MKVNLIFPAAIALAVAAGSDTVVAQSADAATESAIAEELYGFSNSLTGNYQFDGPSVYAALDSGQSSSFTRGLIAGNQYLIGAQCEPDDCQDIYLHVYDSSGALLIENTSGTSFTMVSFQATQSADHTIGITVAACSVNPCHFGIDVYSSPEP